jgi:hypothetical protein
MGTETGFAGHRGAITTIALTPDGRSPVSDSEDGAGIVWNVSDLPARL